jgi:pyruvate formate lyase activating enzyme
MELREAMFYERDGSRVVCNLCPHHCKIKPGHIGLCRVRKNIDQTLYTLNYGRISAFNLDPIEKKPLYHYYPGNLIVSVGSFGCNMKCSFCQNHTIAHEEPVTVALLPENLADKAAAVHGNIGIAYTYNEPSIWYEYVFETAAAAKDRGLKNVLVTNGYLEEEPLERILPRIDAMNIDIKAFDEDYYIDICKGRLAPVLRTVEKAAAHCHVEVTTLVVGGLNDNLDQLEQLGRWLAGINKNIPIHLSRYYPAYHMDRPATPVDTLFKAKDLMMRFLNYVYIGNVPGTDNSTYCPNCGQKLIDRRGYRINIISGGGRCNGCGSETNLINAT